MTLPTPPKLSKAQREATQRAIAREQEWRRRAEALELGEPDPVMARAHLLEFVRYGQRRYKVGWFHRELCKALEWFSAEVTAGRSPRLMIAAPPQHGKSEIVSRRFPVWHLGRNPHHHVVGASYNQEFANRISRDARAVRSLAQEWWPKLAPRAGGTDGVEHWETEGGGSYKGVGAGAGLTGSPAHVLIVDDPLKDREEANSETIRDARWSWFTEVAYTRLAPGGGILVMATRWSEDDPSGRILRDLAKLEGWRVLVFPAIAEEDEEFRKEGEALHPERYTAEYLARVRLVLGERAFAALYLQRPSPAGGGMFQREWLVHRFKDDPQRPIKPYTEIVVSIDCTFKKSKKSDYVSIGAWARYGWTKYRRLGRVRARMSYVVLRQAVRDFVAIWHPGAVLIELKANGEALYDDLKDEIPCLIGFMPDSYGDKETRAELATRYFEAGAVELPEGAEWLGEYVEELVSFPNGTNDDQVDETSQLFHWWSEKKGRGNKSTALQRALADLGQHFGR